MKQFIHTPESSTIFLPQYKFHTENNNWKTRSEKQTEQLIHNHHLLITDLNILGGCSISPLRTIPGIEQNIKGKTIECLWANKKGLGHGTEIAKQATQLYPNTPLFGFSPHGGAFEKAGFTCMENIQSETGAKLWIFNINT